MKMVQLYYQFIKSIRTGDLELYIFCLETLSNRLPHFICTSIISQFFEDLDLAIKKDVSQYLKPSEISQNSIWLAKHIEMIKLQLNHMIFHSNAISLDRSDFYCIARSSQKWPGNWLAALCSDHFTSNNILWKSVACEQL